MTQGNKNSCTVLPELPVLPSQDLFRTASLAANTGPSLIRFVIEVEGISWNPAEIEQVIRGTCRDFSALHYRIQPTEQGVKQVAENAPRLTVLFEEGEADIDYLSSPSQGLVPALDETVRVLVCRRSEKSWQLLFAFDHQQFDGPSVEILSKRFSEHLLSNKEKSCLERRSVHDSYGEIVREYYERLPTILTLHRSAWEAVFRKQYAPLEIPSSYRPWEGNRSGEGYSERIIERPLIESLLAFGKSKRSTTFTVLLTALVMLLRRLLSRDDIVIGVPITLRRRRSHYQSVGCLMNVLPIRIRLHGDPSFQDMLEVVKSEVAQAFGRAEFPYLEICKVVRELHQDGSDPIQVMFTHQPDPFQRIDFDSFHLQTRPLPEPLGALSLALDALECQEGITLALQYRISDWNTDAALSFLEIFSRALRQFGESPSTPLSSLVLTETNGLADHNPPPPSSDLLSPIQLIVSQAKRTPEAAALVSQVGSQISYKKFMEQAKVIASSLPEEITGDPVAISLSDPTGLPQALVGVWLAGGCAVPIDPRMPKALREDVLASIGCQTIIEDSLWRRLIGGGSTMIQEGPSKPEQPALISFTSGSSGNPKPVYLSHFALAHYICSAKEKYQVSSADRILQFSYPGTDFYFEEILLALCSGASLVCPGSFGPLSALSLEEICREQGVTVLDLPTGFFHELVGEMERRDLRLPESISTVILGGESVFSSKLKQFGGRIRDGALVLNTYGPSEATIVTSVYDASRYCSVPSFEENVPIGTPIAGAKCYVLDEYGASLPAGFWGELWIGGPGVALNLQNERARPSVMNGGQKPCFRSGDRAMLLPDGNLLIGGRIDRTVKIRGMRVNLDGVEELLRSVPGVAEAAVTQHNHPADGVELAAYIVTDPRALRACKAETLTPQFFQSELRKTTWPHMIPTHVFSVSKLPKLATGKVDYRRLVSVPTQPLHSIGEPEPPIDQREKIVSIVWSEALRVEKIDRNDDFFLLGGDSLSALLCVSLLEERGYSLDISQFYQNSVLSELAIHLVKRERK